MSDEPFGRQPQPVKVTLEGDPIDVAYYTGRLLRCAKSHGEMTQTYSNGFTIYPRAVND